MPNTVLILDKNEPLTPSSFSVIPTSCLSNINTGKNNILGYWSDPLHGLFGLSQLSSYVMHSLRRPQVSSQHPLPKKISASTSSPGFAGFVMKSQTALVWCLLKMNPRALPRSPEHWGAGHSRSRAGPGLSTPAPLGLEGLCLPATFSHS